MPGGENQAGIQTQSPQSFPAATQFIPIPLTAAPIPVPSLNSVVQMNYLFFLADYTLFVI